MDGHLEYFKYYIEQSDRWFHSSHNGVETKWSTFGRQHSEIYLSGRKSLHFDSNFKEICSAWMLSITACNVCYNIVKYPDYFVFVLFITVTSWWAQWRLRPPDSRLFIQSFIQTQIKENTKARRWPRTGEFPAQMASDAENVSTWWLHHVWFSNQSSVNSCRWFTFHYSSGMLYVTVPLELTWFNINHGLTWISNHMTSKMWDEITFPFLNFNGCTVEV